MSNKEFFNNQSDLTAIKIRVYKKYLSGYLYKVLMQFGRCYIADLFCGCGKNGYEDGSPLILLALAEEILNNPILFKKWPNAEIIIVFNDIEQKYVDNLKEHLKNIKLHRGIRIIGTFCEDFDSMKAKVLTAFSNKISPKFIFLDPFTYSNVSMQDIKSFMDMPTAEVLLFLPTFFSYRFVKAASDYPQLLYFLQKFTVKGCTDYDDIDEFNESIRKKLLTDLKLKYVRAIRLDDGTRKNALFYMTKHLRGMQLMNNIVWKLAEDGQSVKTGKYNEPTLFETSHCTSNFKLSVEKFKEYLRNKKQTTNVEIIEFIAQIGFTSAHARDILNEMSNKGIIKVEHINKNGRGFYVADANWNKIMATIEYLGENDV